MMRQDPPHRSADSTSTTRLLPLLTLGRLRGLAADAVVPAPWTRGLLLHGAAGDAGSMWAALQDYAVQAVTGSDPAFLHVDLVDFNLDPRIPLLQDLAVVSRRVGTMTACSARTQLEPTVTRWMNEARRRRALLSGRGASCWADLVEDGSADEPIRLIVVPSCADLAQCPTCWSDLSQLVSAGPGLGLVPWLALDDGQPEGLADHLRARWQAFVEGLMGASIRLNLRGGALRFEQATAWPGLGQLFEELGGVRAPSAPSAEAARALVQAHRARQATTRSRRGEDFLQVPIGHALGQPFRLEMGPASDAHHASLAGMTGTGKSRLLLSIILHACQQAPPERLQLYLVDLKEGVTFHLLSRLAHVARCVADDDGIQPALAALREFQAEMTRRGALFKEAGGLVTDIDPYNRLALARGAQPLARCLLIIDEFQLLYLSGWEVQRQANAIIDNIARKGRGYGMHFVLCSQSFTGVDLSASARNQIKLRMAMRLASMSECDAAMGGSRGNYAPVDLKDWHMVYNAAAGAPEHNHVVRLAFLSDAELEACLARLPTRSENQPPEPSGAPASSASPVEGEDWST